LSSAFLCYPNLVNGHYPKSADARVLSRLTKTGGGVEYANG